MTPPDIPRRRCRVGMKMRSRAETRFAGHTLTYLVVALGLDFRLPISIHDHITSPFLLELLVVLWFIGTYFWHGSARV